MPALTRNVKCIITVPINVSKIYATSNKHINYPNLCLFGCQNKTINIVVVHRIWIGICFLNQILNNCQILVGLTLGTNSIEQCIIATKLESNFHVYEQVESLWLEVLSSSLHKLLNNN